MSSEVLRRASAHVLVDSEQLDRDGLVALDDATEHHLRRVLRLRGGDSVTITDGQGRWRSTAVDATASVHMLEPVGDVHVASRTTAALTIATAIPKGDRLDWLVQKVTELGADRIVLLHADRSVVRWKHERAAKQLARLQRVADEACRQSRRVWRPRVEGPVDSDAMLGTFVVAEPGGRALVGSDRSVAIGPEGGWTERELAAAADRVGLGENILRTETAAIAVTTLCVTFER